MTPTTDVLKRPTLVLNRGWRPIHVTTVVRALVMLWNDSARIVDPENYLLFTWDDWLRLPVVADQPCIRTGHLRLRVPEVVSLARFDRVPLTVVAFSRRNIARRDHHTCQYCGVQPGHDELTIDHVLPRSQGGPTSWTNCVAACARCNTKKANRTPEQAGMRLRKVPLRPEWKPLFAVHCHDPRLPSWEKFLSEEPSRSLA